MNHDGGSETLLATELVATWPKGSFAENLAVDEAGVIHVTLHTDRAVVRVDSRTGRISPFATFETPVAGLAFDTQGRLFVGGGTPGQQGGVVWAVTPDGAIEKLADLPEALFLNGMALHPDGRLLVVDSILGLVYALDRRSGAASVWLADERLTPGTADGTPGANGIKIAGGFVYISVTARDTILRCAITADGGAGQPQMIAERLRADDFTIGADGSLYIATHPARSLVRLAPDGARATLAGMAEGMLGATAVAFGRAGHDDSDLYVTTTGGTMTVPDEELQLAKLVRVKLGGDGAAERNRRRVVAHFEDFVNRRDLGAIDRNMAADFLDHDGPGGKPVGSEADRAMMAAMHRTYPDLRISLHDVMAEGDKVMVRAVWTGTNAETGAAMRNQGFVLWRLAGGKIVERWATVTPMRDAREAPGTW